MKLEQAVPSKTLPQIKNYYQNYRVKEGLPKTRGGIAGNGPFPIAAAAAAYIGGIGIGGAQQGKGGRKRKAGSAQGASAAGKKAAMVQHGVGVQYPALSGMHGGFPGGAADQLAALQRLMLGGLPIPTSNLLQQQQQLLAQLLAAQPGAMQAQMMQQAMAAGMTANMGLGMNMPPMMAPAMPALGMNPLQLQALMMMSGQAMAAAQQAHQVQNAVPAVESAPPPAAGESVADEQQQQNQQQQEQQKQEATPLLKIVVEAPADSPAKEVEVQVESALPEAAAAAGGGELPEEQPAPAPAPAADHEELMPDIAPAPTEAQPALVEKGDVEVPSVSVPAPEEAAAAPMQLDEAS